MEAAEAIGSSGDYSALIVEALDGGVGDLASGLEPVEQERFMLAESLGDTPHGIDAGA